MNESNELLWLKAKPNQKLMLVAARDKEDFDMAFRSIREFCEFPIDGSMFERPVYMHVPNHTDPFYPISINGDLAAWGGWDCCNVSSLRSKVWLVRERSRDSI